MEGKRYGRLVAVKPLDDICNSYTKWEFRCDCGKITIVAAKAVWYGNTKSCGCLRRDKTRENGLNKTTHGLTKTVEYKTWVAMKARCYNKNVDSYKAYGGRGIRVCNRWLTSFEAFLEDMGEKPGKEYSIERVDVNGDYEPSNCKWATLEEQNNNKRTNIYFTIEGENLTLTQISRKYDIPLATLESRIRRDKLSIEEAVAKKANRRLVTYKGETKTVGEWARQYGLNYGTLRDRLEAGLPLELAVIAQVRKTFIHDGIEKSLRRLAKEFSMSPTGLASRLKRGLTLEQALNEKKWVKKNE